MGRPKTNRGMVLAEFSPGGLLPAHAVYSRCSDRHGFRHTQAEVARSCTFLCGLFAALISVRHIPIFVLVSVPVLSKAVTLLLSRQSFTKGRISSGSEPIRAGINLAVVSVALVVVLLRIAQVARETPSSELSPFQCAPQTISKLTTITGTFSLSTTGAGTLFGDASRIKKFISTDARTCMGTRSCGNSQTPTLCATSGDWVLSKPARYSFPGTPLWLARPVRNTAWSLAYSDDQSSFFPAPNCRNGLQLRPLDNV